MKRYFISLLVLMAFGQVTFAQQAIFDKQNTQPPQVNSDNSVTFRLYAPKAQKVQVHGDFMEGIQDMTNENGLWSFTTPANLSPELYMYWFRVDGIDMQDPGNLMRSRDVRTHMSNFIITKEEGDKGYLYQNHNVAHGNVSEVWYESPKLGMSRRMTIYTPAGYEKGGKYPVMYLLHGAGGDEEAWPTLGRTAQIMDNLIASGKAAPMIVVMPNGNASDDASPYATGLTHKQKPATTYEESFTDIMNYVQKNYRIKKGAKNTAICGLSMGGYHTFSISNLHPGKFDYIGLYSAAIRMGWRQENQPLEEYLEEKQGKAIEAVFAANPQLYWIAIGNTDFLYEQNKSLRNYFDKKGYKYEYFESDGGHIWRNWRIYLTMFAQRLFK